MKKRYYFLGICGVSMATLAIFLKNKGNFVQGSDRQIGKTAIFLKQHGIDIDTKLNRKNIERGIPLKRTMKNLYNNNYLKLKYNKKQGQFKKDIVYKLEDYLNQLEDNKIILYNTDAFDKLRYDLSNKPIEEQKRIFDEELIEIRVIPQIISNDDEATIN